MAFGINEDLNGIEVGSILYEFLYCPSIHESAYGTVSLHLTKEGAEDALRRHKEIKKKEFDKMFPPDSEEAEHMNFGEFEEWIVNDVKVQL